jgi:hypothetical protein
MPGTFKSWARHEKPLISVTSLLSLLFFLLLVSLLLLVLLVLLVWLIFSLYCKIFRACDSEIPPTRRSRGRAQEFRSTPT